METKDKWQKPRNSFFFSGPFFYLLGILSILTYNNLPQIYKYVSKLITKGVVKTTEVVKKSRCDEVQVIQKAKKSVVRVIGKEQEGSGFLVESGAYIGTNYHVVKGNDSPRIVFSDNTPVIGEIFNWDEQIDLAIIKVKKTNTVPLSFGDSDKLTQGQNLIGVGFPLGRELPGEATVTKGSYSAKRESDEKGVEYLQIDGNFNEGNSGSPIINTCGEVVGILTLAIKNTEGLQFAISSKTAKSMVDSLIATGPKLYSPDEYVADSYPYSGQTPVLSAVIQYYNYISTRQLDLAYGLLSKNFKKIAGGYDTFFRGYNTTLNVYLLDIKMDDPDINSVYVKVAAADLVGNKVMFRTFAGVWIPILEDGVWKLDSANISQIE